MKTIFVLIALLLLWESALSSVSWTTKTPTGAQPHQVSKPNVVAVTNRKIVMFNGVKDDCATATNTWYSNEQVYIYDTKTNEGSWLTTTGDIPPAASFATAWKSGHGKVTVGGGGNYPYYYAPFTTYGFDTLYELDIFSGVWTTIETSGDVPSPRLEVSHHEAGDKIYLYGGVAPSPSNPYDYLSYGEVYEYDQSCREFTRLKNSSPLDDGSDGIPTSRYHAHLFKSGNKLEIYQGFTELISRIPSILWIPGDLTFELDNGAKFTLLLFSPNPDDMELTSNSIMKEANTVASFLEMFMLLELLLPLVASLLPILFPILCAEISLLLLLDGLL